MKKLVIQIPRRHFLLYLLIAIGVVLRCTDLLVPDLATDEAQAAFGVSPAWTPLGMFLMQIAQSILGPEIWVVRSVSIVFGIASLVLIFLIAKEYTEEKTALLVTGLAAVFPSHILFSKLAYLSVEQNFWWLLVLYAFLQAKKSVNHKWLVLLFLASVAATMTKTQGLLFPGALLFGMVIEKRKKAFSDPLFWCLAFSMIPIVFYIATHPGIAATVMLYGGNMYGVSGFAGRVHDLLVMWWDVLGIFLIASAMSLFVFTKISWHVWMLLAVGIGTGFLLGPGHEYYATHLVLLALPIGIALAMQSEKVRMGCVLLLAAYAIAVFGPLQNSLTYPLYRETGFWNAHAEEVNEALRGEEAVTVLGSAGHHIRWYVEPEVFVGDNLPAPYPTRKVLLLGLSQAEKVSGRVVYATRRAAVIEQHE